MAVTLVVLWLWRESHDCEVISLNPGWISVLTDLIYELLFTKHFTFLLKLKTVVNLIKAVRS